MKKETVLLFMLLAVSIIIILIVKFIYVDTPEIWEHGYEFGQVMYNLSLGYIASFIFYLIVVQIPEKRNRKNVYAHAKALTEKIVRTGDIIIWSMDKSLHFKNGTIAEADFSYREYGREEFIKTFSEVGPNDLNDIYQTIEENYTITNAQAVTKTLERVNKDIDQLFIYISMLDKEHVKLVNDILYSQLMDMRHVLREDWHNKNLRNYAHLAEIFYDFYSKTRKLKSYMEKNFT